MFFECSYNQRREKLRLSGITNQLALADIRISVHIILLKVGKKSENKIETLQADVLLLLVYRQVVCRNKTTAWSV